MLPKAVTAVVRVEARYPGVDPVVRIIIDVGGGDPEVIGPLIADSETLFRLLADLGERICSAMAV